MKTALVTGAGKRLGKEIAAALAANGWRVVSHYNTSKVEGGVQADLQDFTQLPKLFAAGKVDLLINSASIYERVSFAESSEDDFTRNFNIHVKTPYFLSQMFVKQGGTHIINIVDAFTRRSKSKYFPYLLSKKALLDLSRMLAVELAPEVRVNAILPGIIREYSDNLSPEFLARSQHAVAAAEVIGAIKFLINSTLTGQEIYVDNGEQLI